MIRSCRCDCHQRPTNNNAAAATSEAVDDMEDVEDVGNVEVRRGITTKPSSCRPNACASPLATRFAANAHNAASMSSWVNRPAGRRMPAANALTHTSHGKPPSQRKPPSHLFFLCLQRSHDFLKPSFLPLDFRPRFLQSREACCAPPLNTLSEISSSSRVTHGPLAQGVKGSGLPKLTPWTELDFGDCACLANGRARYPMYRGSGL